MTDIRRGCSFQVLEGCAPELPVISMKCAKGNAHGIHVQDRPSDNPFQQQEYRLLPPGMTAQDLDPSAGLMLHALPVNAAEAASASVSFLIQFMSLSPSSFGRAPRLRPLPLC